MSDKTKKYLLQPHIIIMMIISCLGFVKAQDTDTLILKYAASKQDTIIYKRVIEFDKNSKMYHVRDYFENGQIQMDAVYSSFDKNVKEESQCNYHSNTKEGKYTEWYESGLIEFTGNYKNGLHNGLTTSWYKNGQKEAEENWLNGQLHGRTKYWTEKGDLQFDLTFDHGINQNPKNVSYHYLSYTPKNYNTDTLKRFPLIIYLHGGSRRGTDLKKLYADGIPDQIYRGREFPFIIIAPQCPEHIRWSTDNWFENFYKEVTDKYRIDTNRVYLTGFSLGGAGTWYIGVKYPDKFAAIAPMSGFTSHIDYIDNNLDKLIDMPIWAFHGKIDNVVPFEETERVIKKLEGKNKELRFSVEPEVGHWINWMVYPNQELYDWFLKHDKRMKKQ
ncbi:MAG: prolyl oligopeptidase family serine peptidase [Ignavibacteriales bacterium]|nr:prolyl oligopeptidase family serine peptidase [Ignavibacteriales bacterium]